MDPRVHRLGPRSSNGACALPDSVPLISVSISTVNSPAIAPVLPFDLRYADPNSPAANSCLTAPARSLSLDALSLSLQTPWAAQPSLSPFS
ncbi:hypothetical protein CONPUDRAFT_81504 [Coniophora puteana RWD-64-598 SS2]|uniref:Uncharacterized protein n=1 Tax=Coniophora puteana (strain RWD-64-598) TaxID=741705 RepID=A0A5M3MRQ8_CONPW|nr:uncharacterized protein CONPUDRAFT_81504 [Coniophora puteana RWD-64-598 SS2]EIW81780.1 hypothetical protein CONPUDRAFT_81504 [Coniophora puteana RWD-64-598 SS2]